MKKAFIFLIIVLIDSSVFAQGYKIGDKAADFRLKDIDGYYVSLKDFYGTEGFIIIFTANYCPFVQAYEDRIIEIDKKYKNFGYPVIAINVSDSNLHSEDSYEMMKIEAKKKKVTFPYLYDEGQKVYLQFGAKRVPQIFLLKKTRDDFIVKYIGAIDDNYADAKQVQNHYLTTAIDALIAGKKIAIPETKTIGCEIQQK